MAESSEERGLLSSSRSFHRRYGSTSVNMKKSEFVVKHHVSKYDTLQGIALKYGVTVECIKLHNKLWTAGSIFLYDFLEVPVTKSVFDSFNSNSSNCLVHQSNVPCDTVSNLDSSETCSSGSSSPALERISSSCSNIFDYSDSDGNNFLSKIDSNIAITKLNLQKLESHKLPVMQQMDVDDSPHLQERQRNGTTSYQNGWTEQLAPQTAIINPGRRFTMSLKKLLKDHEDFYEL